MDEVLSARVEHDVETGKQAFVTTLLGRPLPLKRSIFVKKLKRAVNPSKREQNQMKNQLRRQLEECNAPTPFVGSIEKSVRIEVTFRCRRPNTHFTGGDRKRPVRRDCQHKRHTCGDIDNLLKFVLDAGNGILFLDDRQISDLSAKVIWHSDPMSDGSTTISVEETLAC